jgi:hypothetical protein
MTMRAARSSLFALAVFAGALSVAGGARADDPAAAQQLFDEGRALAAQGKTSEACPKFEESFRLDPRSGTKFNLADCYEVTGRTATAWTLFLEVASESQAVGRADRESVARERASALAPKLSHLTLRVQPSSRVPGLTLTRAETVVGPAQWGSAVPVDPGTYSIKAEASGYRAWTTSVNVADGAASAVVDVPVLERLGAETGAATDVTSLRGVDTTSEPKEPTPQHLVAYGLGGAGVVTIGVGAFFGIRALSKHSSAKSAGCDGNVCPNGSSANEYNDARSAGNVATVLFAVGAGVLVAGAVVYFTTPHHGDTTTASSSSLAFGIGPAGAFVKGRW